MFKLYVAGASLEIPRVRHWSAALERSGLVTLTHRWWECLTVDGVNGRDLPREQQRLLAEADTRGVREADVVWLLYPRTYSTGTHFELGYAYALGKAIVVTGVEARRCIFPSLVEHCDDDRDGFASVLALAAVADE